MAVPSTELAKDPRALTAIAQWATRDDKPDAKARRSAAVLAMRAAGVMSPEEFEGYGSQGWAAQKKRWDSGYYLKLFPQIDSTTLNLYSNWYKLLYPPVLPIAIPSGSGGTKFIFVPPTVDPTDQGLVPEAGETPPPGEEPPVAPTPSRGMGPFLLAGGAVLVSLKMFGK